MRVRMTQCVGEELEPPTDPLELEEWCAAGNSARPVQGHIGGEGCVLWVNENGSVCVRFDDGDERLLFREEIEFVGS